MKSDHPKLLISILLIILISWTFSCSGRSGSPSGQGSKPADLSEKEAPEQLIKILSPDENAEFKLNQTLK